MKSEKRAQPTKAFVTGCDKNTFWQLKWFITNLFNHTDLPLEFYDFGLTIDQVLEMTRWKFPGLTYHKDGIQGRGWFNKPQAFHFALTDADSVCWLDTDVEVVGEVDSIFDYAPPLSRTLAMVPDHPWIKRRGGPWYNSGVMVTSKPSPELLRKWINGCAKPTEPGDQEILYKLLVNDPLNKLSITPLPHKYNVLRLDVQDNKVPRDARIMHWTGAKGNEIIRSKMK